MATPILSARDLHKTLGLREILAGVNVTIDAGQRVGLVGRNGSGKSTLARLLAGELEPDGGEVVRGREVRVGVLEQAPSFEPERSALDVALDAKAEWRAALTEHERVSARLAEGEGDQEALLAAQAAAGERVEKLGGWELQHEAEAMLGHLGIARTDQTVGTMSGGERRRVALAQLFLSAPDLAVLDEPTNHLDIPTIEWLERYLVERWAGALLLVTHDRYLLDRVVSHTWEIDAGLVHVYAGGWGDYLEARAERQAHAERVESNRQNFLRRELEWLRRQPKARTTKQKARLARAETALSVEGPRREKDAAIAISEVRTGKTILEVEELAVEVAGRRLVEDLTLRLSKGDRIGIVGPNGCGKSSLIRVLLGEAEPAAGHVTLGKNTRVAFLDQQRTNLDDAATIFDNVAGGASRIELGGQEMDVRTYLERFLFRSAEQRKLVGTLSGGERARVAIAKILREGANLVVLDEPTNDLDVTTLAALEEALLEFGGTLLMVTHDRWLLDRIATAILAFEGDGKLLYRHGDYSSYLEDRERRRREEASASASAESPPVANPPPAPAPAASASPAHKKLTYAERIELDGMEARIEAAEAEVEQMEAELAGEGFYDRGRDEQAEFLAALADRRAALEALVERWGELEERAGG